MRRQIVLAVSILAICAIFLGPQVPIESGQMYAGVSIGNVSALPLAVTLCEAVDNCDLTWTTGGSSSWFGQESVAHDGIDAAQSGDIMDSQESWMETTVPASGTLSFWWKVSSESSFDYLLFYINGTYQDSISGSVDWQQMSYAVPAGATVRWRYSKDGSLSEGSDCGWVDQVVFIPDDPLVVTPADEFVSSGYQGGPFAPNAKVYTLTNTSGANIVWSATKTQIWLTLSNAGGTLLPGTSVDVEVAVNANANGLTPGEYSDVVSFINDITTVVHTRGATLTIMAIPGNIAVEDSVAPTDDLAVPFGQLILGQSRTEQITVRNTDPTYDLVVESISLLGEYYEDFEDGQAQGWEPIVPSRWSVVSGEYRAAETITDCNMQSNYTGDTWDDGAYQVTVRRTGSVSSATPLIIRATDDFNWGADVGSAYLIGISGDQYYYVAKYISGTFEWIQSWTYSSYLNAGEVPNTVLANMEGGAIQVYFNGNLAWSGSDSGALGAGRIGLGAYTTTTEPTVYYFDEVQVSEPLTAGQATLSAEQAWYNAHPCKDGTPEQSPSDFKPQSYPGSPERSAAGNIGVLSGAGAFRLGGLPALPVVVPPGGSFTFDVTFAPGAAGAHEAALQILSNDADQPVVDVLLTGSALEDLLIVTPEEDFVSFGYVGGPFTPQSKTYTLTNTDTQTVNWTAGASAGWLTVAPASGALVPGASANVEVSLNTAADGLPAGTYSDSLVFTNLNSQRAMMRDVSLTVELTLCEAVDNCELTWTTGGSSSWFGQESVAHDGIDAAQSGDITDSQESWMETTVPASGTLSFWWKVSSESDFDHLRFYINLTLQDSISGSVDWQQMSYAVPAGATVRWRYSKDGSLSEGSDCGWVDQVVFIPDDPLVVTPADEFVSSGYQGGPFGPNAKVYTLTNTSGENIVWSAAKTQIWLTLWDSGGTLLPGTSVDVEVAVNANANGLTPGEYSDVVSFTNDTTGIVHTRGATLTVMAIPGNIAVEDSVAPTDDLAVPFGQLILGQSRTEQITVRNTDPTHDLVVSDVRLTGGASGGMDSPPPSGSVANDSSLSTWQTNPENPSNLVGAGHRPDQLLVKFRPGVMTTARESVHAAMGARRMHSYRRIPVDVIQLPKGSDLQKFIAMYEARPDVAYAEPNYELRALTPPNDPRFGELWGLNNTGQTGGTPGADISALEAWDTTTGSSDVIVAVIDTGVDYNHQDLAGNMWVNPSPTFGDVHGARWTNGDGSITSGDPMDGNGHGTHCSGTIGGIGNNGIGVTGVNWNVRIMALKFLSDAGSGTTADAISALEYAINHEASLTSNSWGGGEFSQALKDMIDSAAAANQVFVAAAGNDGTNNDVYPHYPSNYDCSNIIAVASSDHNDQPSVWPSGGGSNYGATSVDLAAPGSDILSSVPGNSYAVYSGTSMAAPHVSGVAALMLSMNPGASYADVKNWIMESVDPLPQWSGLTVTGGRLNAAEAVRLSNPHFQVANLPTFPVVVPPGGSFTFDVVYSPVSEGMHSSCVLIESNDADQAAVGVLLTGSAVDQLTLPIWQAKTSAAGSPVLIQGAIVTAAWDGVFYIEAEDRSCGIRVEKSSHGVTQGMKADVAGHIATSLDGERYIAADSVAPAGSGSILPVGMANSRLGGCDFCDLLTGDGQQGIGGASGLNNIGLLIRTWGKVTDAGSGWFYLDDGSGVEDGTGSIGIYVDCTGLAAPAIGDKVQLTGISGCRFYAGQLVNVIRPRSQSDIVILTSAIPSPLSNAADRPSPRSSR